MSEYETTGECLRDEPHTEVPLDAMRASALAGLVLRLEAELTAERTKVAVLVEAMQRIIPFLPILDTSPARLSEHAQAAGAVRDALIAAGAK